MLKLSNLRARLAARKRGYEATQMLLFTAFVIIGMISVLALYQVVMLNSNKTKATQVVSMASGEARTLYRNSDNFTGLSSATLIAAGAVPTDAVSGTNIVLPYQGTVAFAPSASGNTFEATVTFPASTRSTRALCTFLSTGQTGVIITGPMGSEYQLGTADCASTTAPTFGVTYQR